MVAVALGLEVLPPQPHALRCCHPLAFFPCIPAAGYSHGGSSTLQASTVHIVTVSFPCL